MLTLSIISPLVFLIRIIVVSSCRGLVVIRVDGSVALHELLHNLVDSGIDVDLVGGYLDFGRLGCLSQHFGHHGVHLEGASEALSVPQVVIFLLNLPARLVHGQLVLIRYSRII